MQEAGDPIMDAMEVEEPLAFLTQVPIAMKQSDNGPVGNRNGLLGQLDAEASIKFMESCKELVVSMGEDGDLLDLSKETIGNFMDAYNLNEEELGICICDAASLISVKKEDFPDGVFVLGQDPSPFTEFSDKEIQVRNRYLEENSQAILAQCPGRNLRLAQEFAIIANMYDAKIEQVMRPVDTYTSVLKGRGKVKIGPGYEFVANVECLGIANTGARKTPILRALKKIFGLVEVTINTILWDNSYPCGFELLYDADGNPTAVLKSLQRSSGAKAAITDESGFLKELLKEGISCREIF